MSNALVPVAGSSQSLMLYPGVALKAHEEVMRRQPELAAATANRAIEQARAYRTAARPTNSIDILV